MTSNAVEFVPLDGREADASLLADTNALQNLSTPAITKPLLSSRPGATLGQQNEPRPRTYQPWKRFQPTPTAWEWQEKDDFWCTLGQATVVPGDGVAKRAGQKLRDATRTQIKNMSSVVRKYPSVLLVPLLFCGLLIGLGIFGVRTAARNAEETARVDAEAAALKVAGSFTLTLDQSIVPVLSLGTFIKETPDMTQLVPQFKRIAGQLLKQTGPVAAAFQLKLVPFGIVRAIEPPLVDTETLGLNLFTDPTRREEALRTVELNTVWLAGPLAVPPNNTSVLIARNPVFIPVSDPGETWGNDEDAAAGNTNCSACYNPELKTKFWGFAAAYIDFDRLTHGTGSPLQLLQSRNYRFSLTKPGGSEAEPPVVLAQSFSPPPSSESVSVVVTAPGESWQLAVYPEEGFRPDWEAPLLVVVVIFSVALTIVMFVAMLNHRRLIILLRARLPVKALRTLRVGQPFYDYFPAVTVLDLQVVRYTNQEAGVNPLEVVKLLNEVYALLDGLVEKHQLHKVETYGDSYVAVGGCPEAGGKDAITWAAHVAHCARDMVIAAAKYRSSYGQRVQIQIGLNSGPMVAAVIDGGKRLPRYCLLGDTMAVASELCAASQPQAIHVSRTTADLLAESGDPMVMLVPRGISSVRRRAMFTSWLQVDLMAGAYGGAYGGRQASTDLLARYRDDDEVSLDGFNIVRKTLPFRDDDGLADDEEDRRLGLLGSFSRRLEPGSWAVVCEMMGMRYKEADAEVEVGAEAQAGGSAAAGPARRDPGLSGDDDGEGGVGVFARVAGRRGGAGVSTGDGSSPAEAPAPVTAPAPTPACLNRPADTLAPSAASPLQPHVAPAVTLTMSVAGSTPAHLGGMTAGQAGGGAGAGAGAGAGEDISAVVGSTARSADSDSVSFPTGTQRNGSVTAPAASPAGPALDLL